MATRPIDRFRSLLDHLDGDVRAHQLAFFRSLREIGADAVGELDGRLPGPRAPIGLRRLALEASYYYPWSSWTPILERILRYEPDFGIFQTGVQALGRIASAEALEALRSLITIRQGAEFKEFLAEALGQADPQEAFNHHLARLLQGSANAGEANDAAQRLARLVDGSHVESLGTLTRHPDLLVFRHALALLALVPTREAAQALVEILADSHREVLADRRLKEVLGDLRSLPAPEAAAAASAALAAGHDPGLAEFYREVQAATEGKASQFPVVLAQTAEGLHQRARRLAYAFDAAAEGLADLALRGLAEPRSALDLLVACFRDQAGREGVARAIARLVPASDEEVYRLVLESPDGAQRAALVEVLGARREPALEPALLLACQDSLSDIADRARHFLGQLPGAQAMARTLLHGATPAEFQLGLQLTSEQRFAGLVPDLLERLAGADREDQTLQLVEALGAVGAPEAAPALVERLHSGQSQRIQVAIAQALRDLGGPDAAKALCARVDEIRLPMLHAVAVEALAGAYGAALPANAGPVLLDQARKAWNDRNPWPLRLRVVQALSGIELDAPEAWRDLAELVAAALAEKRAPGVWSTDELHLVQAAGREFMRKASS